jgi:hypothetical protein
MSGLIPGDAAGLCWYIQTFRDVSRLRQTLASVRTLYPDSRVLVVSDGDPDPEIGRACSRYSAEFTLRQRLMTVEHGGAPVQQMLEAFLAAAGAVLIKIDPDTDVRRRFSVMPAEDDPSVYGTVQSSGPASNRLISIQGGCIIIPRRAAAELASSTLLTSERLRPPALEWAINEVLVTRARDGLTSYDWSLGWACRELGLLSKDHPEVFSRYQARLVNLRRHRHQAVAHPRFELRQLFRPGFYAF